MFPNSITEILSAVFVATLVGWYLYYQYCFTYWTRKGLKTVPPVFPAGNITSSLLGRESLYVKLQNVYSEFKAKGERHVGLYFFNGPVYFPIDTEIVKRIMTTDFDHFTDRGTYLDEEKHKLTAHLFSITGSKWRVLRAKLSPTFSSGKLKTMYAGIFMKNTENLVGILEPLARRREEINVKNYLNSFTGDIITSSALGLDCRILEDPASEMAHLVLNLFSPPLREFLKTLVLTGLRNPGNITRVISCDSAVEDFFSGVVAGAIKHREDGKVVRNDFLSLLMEVRDKVGLSDNEMVAQSFLFFLAGFETSSQTMTYCLHELAHNQELQDRLREELHDGLGTDFTKYTYEGLLKLPYLDKVIKETLRLYPVLGFFNRICVKTYKVPGTDVVIEKGTPVLISTLGPQRDPEFFPDPLAFDPERFEEKDAQVPFSYMPFGEGPRICIGMRYGQLQTKLGVAAVVSQYRVLPSEKTPRLVEFDKLPLSLSLSKRDGVFLKICKI